MRFTRHFPSMRPDFHPLVSWVCPGPRPLERPDHGSWECPKGQWLGPEGSRMLSSRRKLTDGVVSRAAPHGRASSCYLRCLTTLRRVTPAVRHGCRSRGARPPCPARRSAARSLLRT